MPPGTSPPAPTARTKRPLLGLRNTPFRRTTPTRSLSPAEGGVCDSPPDRAVPPGSLSCRVAILWRVPCNSTDTSGRAVLSTDLPAEPVDLIRQLSHPCKEANPVTRISICLSLVMSLSASAAWAQDPTPTTSPQLETTPSTDPVATVDPVPNGETLPPVDQTGTSQWTYERQMQNREGTVTNTHRYMETPEEGRFVREHAVTNPRGEMTQTWERVRTEDGYTYRRSQVWTNPDGTPVRQHERTTSSTSVPVETQSTEQVTWWQKLNPFRKRGNAKAGSAAASASRRGFTIGTSNGKSARVSSASSGDHPSVSGSQNTHRPSWAGGAPRSVAKQGPSSHANSRATAARANSASGLNR